MADKIIPNLPKSEAPTFDDLMLVVDTPASTPTNKKVTLANLFNKIPTTIGYGSEAVGTVNISSTTQALDDKALFLCTDIATGRILIDNPFPFALVKVTDPNINKFLKKDLVCGSAKVEISKPDWLN